MIPHEDEFQIAELEKKVNIVDFCDKFLDERGLYSNKSTSFKVEFFVSRFSFFAE